jgi:2-polyprenyl-3-methyl-5-hydroxy-6-metoxy-1,4-benzoquinol methylase
MSTSASLAYAFDNDSSHAGGHHDALTALLDGFTMARIAGLIDLTDKRCLEVAAGGGGVARWLAECVGDNGAVVATDIKPQHIPAHPRLTALQHDITTEALPGTFDVIHARLLLNHLPQRREVLRKLAGALNPGGVLLTEDFDPTRGPEIVAHAPDGESAALIARYQDVHLGALASHGNDRTWSRRAYSAMVAEGLTEVETVVHGRSWPGGSPGCRLLAAGLAQLRSELVAAGIAEDELDRTRELLDDPRVVLHGHPLYSTSGRRAG